MFEEVGEDFREIKVKMFKSEKAGLNFADLTFSLFHFECLFKLTTRTVSLRGRKTTNVMSKNNEQEINRIIYLMQQDKSVDAPTDAIRWAKNIFLTRAVEPKKSMIERVLAVLQMDLSPNRAAFGERSAFASQARQMLFQAGENALDIRIAKTEKGFFMHGQVLGEGFANCIVKLGELETMANENSEFKFMELPTAKYDLIVRSGEQEIVVESLELK
ncbi:MAG: hypothetical protein M3367_16590 [Acidobacteriota bacterium]|nr:hypothetical protein [Acidobacteriota bacterium]